MTQERRILLGRVIGAFGVRGELKLQSFTEPMASVMAYQPWLLVHDGSEREVSGARGRQTAKGMTITLPDVADRDAADALAGAEVWVPRSRLPPPKPDEYYWVDLEGMDVVNLEGVSFGSVSHLFETPANDVLDADPQPLFEHVVRKLAPHQLAYLHLIEGATGGPRELPDRPFDYAALKAAYRAAGGQGAWMVNNGYDLPLAQQALADGADLVAFGKSYIANPDLVTRLRVGGPFNTPDKMTFYGGGEKGYTDYPTLAG